MSRHTLAVGQPEFQELIKVPEVGDIKRYRQPPNFRLYPEGYVSNAHVKLATAMVSGELGDLYDFFYRSDYAQDRPGDYVITNKYEEEIVAETAGQAQEVVDTFTSAFGGIDLRIVLDYVRIEAHVNRDRIMRTQVQASARSFREGRRAIVVHNGVPNLRFIDQGEIVPVPKGLPDFEHLNSLPSSNFGDNVPWIGSLFSYLRSPLPNEHTIGNAMTLWSKMHFIVYSTEQ